MPSLPDLPAELMECVLGDCTLPTISRLSRVSKTLYNFLSPRLYNSIEWTWKDTQPSPPFHLLLRTILSNTLLASRIKSLRLRGGGLFSESDLKDEWSDWRPLSSGVWRPIERTRSIWTRDRRSSLSANNIHHVENLLSDIYRPPLSQWMSELERGSVDVILALILTTLPSLERLDIGFAYLHRSHFIPAVLRHGMMSRQKSIIFPNLKSVVLAADIPASPTGFWSDLDLFRPFLYLPRIKSIQAVFTEPTVLAWPGIAPFSASLTKLDLHKTNATESTLDRILTCTPALKHLTYDHWCIICAGYPTHNAHCFTSEAGNEHYFLIRCRVLSNALARVQRTLETLVLKIHYEDMHNHTWIKHPGSPGFQGGVLGRLTFLRQTPKLAHLEVPWVLLFGWELEQPAPWVDSSSWVDVLPPSIRSLTLRDDMRDFLTDPHWWTYELVLDHVRALLRLRDHNFRHLGCISFTFIYIFEIFDDINGCWSTSHWYDGNAIDLRALCENNNITCEIKREPNLMYHPNDCNPLLDYF